MKPEIIFNMPRAEYDRRGEVNWSTLKLMMKSPAHYHASLIAPVAPDTDARQRGRGTHCATLEPDRFRSEFVAYSDGARNPRHKAWQTFLKANAGKEILTPAMMAECVELARAVRSAPAALPYLSGGRSEVTCIWPFVREQVGGIAGYTTWCRSRLDFVANVGALVDLKVTRDASPSGFGRECGRYSYHVQAASYRQAYYACTGKLLPYKLVAVESTWPHVTAVYNVTARAFELGWETYVDLHDRRNACSQANHWPGYAEAEMDLELPAYLDPDDDENDDLTGLITTEAA